jgi:hypothetical protein
VKPFWKRRERPSPDLVQAMEAALLNLHRDIASDLAWMLNEDGLDDSKAAARAFLSTGRFRQFLYDGTLDQLAQLAELLGYKVTVTLERRHQETVSK